MQWVPVVECVEVVPAMFGLTGWRRPGIDEQQAGLKAKRKQIAEYNNNYSHCTV